MDGDALRREWHALWECSWARIPFLPPLGQPAQMWPWVHAPILWCASSNCSQHTGYMCNQAILYTHTVSVFWGVLLIWKHNSLQIRRESASLSSTIKFLWRLWCSYHLQTRGSSLFASERSSLFLIIYKKVVGSKNGFHAEKIVLDNLICKRQASESYMQKNVCYYK